MIATHQKSSKDILADNESTNTTDYFGYSTDVWYRTGDFDGIRNIAANAQVGYENDTFGANLEYRMRGAQASMLYDGMLHPLAPYDCSGIVWYQGESNTGTPDDYGILLKKSTTEVCRYLNKL